jgi:hypothetical protein
MIDVKQAVQAARSYAQDVLGQQAPTVEEIERDSYKDHDTWRIVLGFRVFGVGILPKEYKSFYVDAETGETLAVKIRELATR